jgi:hypothetical protein
VQSVTGLTLPASSQALPEINRAGADAVTGNACVLYRYRVAKQSQISYQITTGKEIVSNTALPASALTPPSAVASASAASSSAIELRPPFLRAGFIHREASPV